MRRVAQKLCRSERGAVAPTIALSLTGLIAIGGLAFDYARLANLDTELQDAADQAALGGRQPARPEERIDRSARPPRRSRCSPIAR